MENSKKIERLDTAFLFIVGLVGLLFTITQVYMEGISGLIEISPLILLGVFLPFYIGYLRGAIEVDSVIERIRGWVYLAVGISTYLAFFIMRINTYLYWIFILIAYLSTYSLKKWFNATYEIADNTSNFYAFSGTVISAFALAVISRQVMWALLLPSFVMTSDFCVNYFYLILFVVIEKLSRNIIEAQLPFRQQEINKLREMWLSPVGDLFFGFGLLTIVTTIDLRIVFFYFQTCAFFLIGLIIHMFGTSPYNPFADIFFFASIMFATFGLGLFLRIKEIDFSFLSRKSSVTS